MNRNCHAFLAAGTILLAGCPDEAICGDHRLDPGEGCDGPGEGCDTSCRLTGASAWTLQRSDPDKYIGLLDVAVAPNGHIVVLGIDNGLPGQPEQDGTPWMLALDPAGSELWRVPLPSLSSQWSTPSLAIDAEGWIYVRGRDLRRYDPQGTPSWLVTAEDIHHTAIAISDDAIYTVGVGLPEFRFGVQRREIERGALVWQQFFGADDISYVPLALAVADDSVVALGTWNSLDPHAENRYGTARVKLDALTGDDAVFTFEAGNDDPSYTMAALPAGDLVVAGSAQGSWDLRRESTDGEVRWKFAIDFPSPDAAGLGEVQVGADETIAVTGSYGWDPRRGFVRALSGDGTATWSIDYVPESALGAKTPEHLAFGPGFLVVAGTELHADSSATMWIEKIGPK